MDRWEFTTIQLEPKAVETGNRKNPTTLMRDADYFSEQVNAYGKEGWDLVSCFCTEAQVNGGIPVDTGGTNGIFAMFKRKIN